MKEKITELEGLRGVLAWWVVAGHLLVVSGIEGGALPKALRPLLRGDIPVDVFIILSGFVIFMLLDKGRDSYATFITRRFFRLFPTYLCCLLAMIPLGFAAVKTLRTLPWSGEPVLAWIIADWTTTHANLWPHLIAHLTMLHGMLPREVLADSPGAILGPAWSISLEWQFYLVAPFLLLLVRRDVRWFAAIGAVVAICALAAPSFGGMFEKGKYLTWSLPAFLPLKAIYFFCGACSFTIYKRAPELFRGETLARLLIATLVGLCALTQSPPLILWCAVLGAHLLRTSGSTNAAVRAITGFLNAAPVQWLGRISYSSYLCHVPVLYGVMLMLVAVRPEWDQWSFLAWLSALSAPLVMLLSQGLYRGVEMPFILAAKTWTAGWARPRPLASAPLGLDENPT